jgi:23S rRNA pseudouridine2605 synthase
MCQQCGLKVLSLQRVAVGEVRLGDLPVGKFRELTLQEVEYLKKAGERK